MEAGIVNLLEPGDTAIVAEAGFFGRRLGDIAERHGARVVRVTAPWGETVPNAALLDALDRHPEARLIAVVHAETSTGALHPLRELGDRAVRLRRAADGRLRDVARRDPARRRRRGASTTPTAARRSASRRRPAWRRWRSRRARGGGSASRRTPVPFALDLELLRRYWVDRPAVYHHTTPILGVYALHEALRLVLEEGLEARWARHAAAGAHLQTALRGRGLELLADPHRQMAPLTAVRVPDGVDGKAVQAPAARRVRDRGRRRARPRRPADVADRADGPQRDDRDRDARARPRSTRCSSRVGAMAAA